MNKVPKISLNFKMFTIDFETIEKNPFRTFYFY